MILLSQLYLDRKPTKCASNIRTISTQKTTRNMPATVFDIYPTFFVFIPSAKIVSPYFQHIRVSLHASNPPALRTT
jgi:hypothetical protein